MSKHLTIRCPQCRTVALSNPDPQPITTATTWAFDCKVCKARMVATIKPDFTVMVFPVGRGKSGHYDNRLVSRPPPVKPTIKLTPPKARPTVGLVLQRAGAC